MNLFARNRKELMNEPIIINQDYDIDQPKPIDPNPRPKPKLVLVKSNSIESYEKLAQELDFYPGQLLEEQLLRFFKENDFELYDSAAVFDYLYYKAHKEGKRWIWRPLREKDKTSNYAIHGREMKDGWRHGCYYSGSEWSAYTMLVPERVLRKIKQIEENFPNKVQFFVSDYSVPQPDPFIMVTALGVRNLIFDVWDEPDF